MSKDSKPSYSGSWIQRVAEQSWEPELLISGIAIFATLQVPGILQEILLYYQYNLQGGTGLVEETLPLLIYGAFVAASKILSAAFILHFVIRAFWVGLVGLNSVYPKGIQYDKLDYSRYYRRLMLKRVGNASQFLKSVDETASLIFSTAFAFVLLLIGIGIAYMIFFLLMNGMKLILSEESFQIYSSVLATVGLIFFFGVAVLSIMLNLKSIREKRQVAVWFFRLNWTLGNILFPMIYKPIQYLTFTFMSNMNAKRFFVSIIMFFVLFFGLFIQTLFSAMGVNVVEARNFYSSRTDTLSIQSDWYGNENRFEDSMLPEIHLNKRIYKQGEIAELFIPYPKRLDVKLDAFCEEPVAPEELTRYEQRRWLNQNRLACIEEYFDILINESEGTQSQLFYSDLKGYRGLRAMIPLPDTLEKGQHMLNLRTLKVDPEDAERDSLNRDLRYEEHIPFWVQQ